MMRFSDLKAKDVINLRDCKKLGRINDLEFDECKGCIRKIIVAEKAGIMNFFCCGEEFCIPFCNIKQIGPDIILVDFCC